MTDTLSPAARSERMGRIKAKDSVAELAARSIAHRLGFRFRLHRRDLPGCPDLVFPRLMRVIFVHGCFWHRHPSPECKLARLPKSRLDFWETKLTGNRERDVRNQAALAALGWKTMVVWECELARKEEVQAAIREFLGGDDGGKAAREKP